MSFKKPSLSKQDHQLKRNRNTLLYVFALIVIEENIHTEMQIFLKL